MAETITVSKDEAEQRIDRWLRRRFGGLAQGQVEKMCRKGDIRVDGGRVKASTRVGPGQVVRVPPYIGNLQSREAEAQPEKTAEPQASPQLIHDLCEAVLYRDEHLLVLNKPPGVPVQGGSKLKSHIAGALDGLKFDREDAPRLIHRLDRDTSGLLVLARTGAAASTLGGMFRTRAVEKIYFAAVAGRPHPSVG
ncbi:MAG: RluA family pseudouridine synthase, partial [Pseudomonadota bacterium]